MLGVVDESTPAYGTGSFVYALGLVVLPSGQQLTIGDELRQRLNRRNPFHWEREGPLARRHYVDVMSRFPIRMALAAQVTAPSDMSRVRALLMREQLLPVACELGVQELVIESRSAAENNRDTLTVRNWAREHGVRLRHSFGTKADPLTWLADGAAGLFSDSLLGRGDGEVGVLTSAHKLVFLRHVVQY